LQYFDYFDWLLIIDFPMTCRILDASGLLKTSPALADRLARAERELASLEPAHCPATTGNVAVMLPRVMDKFRELAQDLGRLAQHDVVRARTEIQRLVGMVELKPENGILVAEINKAHVAGALLTAAGARQQMDMVAGAGFEPATFGL
jgi:hypothetical protein